MKRKVRTLVTLALLGLGGLAASEEKSASEIPGLPDGVESRLIFSDSFEREKLTATTEYPGEWRSRDKQVANGHTVALKDGRLVVKHLPGKHPLIVFYNLAEEDHVRDVALSVRFRLEGEEDGISVGFNGENSTEGHARVCGVKVDASGFGVSDATGKGEHPQCSIEAAIEPGAWHTVWLVIQGDTATVRVDEREPITLESKGLACVKNTVKFGPSKGGAVEVDEVKLWALDGR